MAEVSATEHDDVTAADSQADTDATRSRPTARIGGLTRRGEPTGGQQPTMTMTSRRARAHTETQPWHPAAPDEPDGDLS
jgi:hypothetical protein